MQKISYLELFKYISMKLSNFDYDLPKELIAQFPISPRHDAKLLDYSGFKITDKKVYNLPDILSKNDLLIINNTKVIPSKITGHSNNKNILITFHKKINNLKWLAFAKPAKNLSQGDKIIFNGFTGTIKKKHMYGEVEISLNISSNNFMKKLFEIGQMPLPPYIKRKENVNKDFFDYQTYFASKIGSVASPTAGLHFTKELIENLIHKKIKISEVTLHVGAGTFLPIRDEDISKHQMHNEWGHVSKEVIKDIKNCKRNGGRIIAIGTTSLRVLESAYYKTNSLKPFSGFTNIFIKPGIKINTVDLLLTNFHMPKSTLLILTHAFAGEKNVKNIYNHAIKNSYRFYSYGDCCLIRNSNETFSV